MGLFGGGGTFEEGKAAVDKGELRKALKILLPYAKKDNAEAMYLCGQIYNGALYCKSPKRRNANITDKAAIRAEMRHNDAVDKEEKDSLCDFRKAQSMMEKAAQLGHPGAQYQYAIFCDTIPPINAQKALEWYEKAGENGVPEAAEVCVCIYEKGISFKGSKCYNHPYLPLNPAKAEQWKRHAFLNKAERGDPVQLLAVAKSRLTGMTPNTEETMEMLRRAAQPCHEYPGGYPEAIKTCMQYEKEPEKRAEWCQKLAECGHRPEQWEAARAFEKGALETGGRLFPPDIQKAIKCYEALTDTTHTSWYKPYDKLEDWQQDPGQACVEAARLYEQQSDDESQAKALGWYVHSWLFMRPEGMVGASRLCAKMLGKPLSEEQITRFGNMWYDKRMEKNRKKRMEKNRKLEWELVEPIKLEWELVEPITVRQAEQLYRSKVLTQNHVKYYFDTGIELYALAAKILGNKACGMAYDRYDHTTPEIDALAAKLLGEEPSKIAKTDNETYSYTFKYEMPKILDRALGFYADLLAADGGKTGYSKEALRRAAALVTEMEGRIGSAEPSPIDAVLTKWYSLLLEHECYGSAETADQVAEFFATEGKRRDGEKEAAARALAEQLHSVEQTKAAQAKAEQAKAEQAKAEQAARQQEDPVQTALESADAADREGRSEEAKTHYARAAELGSGHGAWRCAVLYAAEPAKAEPWRNKAADLGYPQAQLYYGICYLTGRRGELSPQKARPWLEKAALQNDDIAARQKARHMLNRLNCRQ